MPSEQKNSQTVSRKRSRDATSSKTKPMKSVKTAITTDDSNDEIPADEAALEKLVFGGKGLFEDPATDDEIDEEESSDESEVTTDVVTMEVPESEHGQTFFFDAGPSQDMTEDESEEEDEEEEEEVEKEEEDNDKAAKKTEDVLYGGKPGAWVDEDDEKLVVSIADEKRLRKLRHTEDEQKIKGYEYEQRLRHQFEKIYPRPSWADATLPNENDEQSDFEEEVSLRSSKSTLQKKNRVTLLPPDLLEVTRMKNANQMSYSQGVVSSVEFHPNAQILLTTSLDKTLRLFQIDGKANPKIQSVHFDDMPVHKAAFITGNGDAGTQVLVTGRRKFFYTYDLQAGRIHRVAGIRGREQKSLERYSVSPDGSLVSFLGRDGHVSLVSTKTWQWVGDVKMNGGVKSCEWTGDSKQFYGIGPEAEVYLWDIRNYSCVKRFRDDGGFKPTCLSTSRNDNYLAVGSQTGIVNVYDSSASLSKDDKTIPRLLKSLGNLTTSITSLKFNHDSQMLGMASKMKKDQFRLVHLPSQTVFQNWPTANTPLSYVQCFDFSPRGGYLALGNDKGRVLLYRLMHYGSA